MTEKCPNEECHNRLQETRKSLFGDDGTGGLLGCVQTLKRNSISRATVWAFLIVLGIPLFATGLKVWFGHESSTLRFADQQTVSALRERVSVQESQYKTLCESLADIKTTLTEIKKDVKAIEQRPGHGGY